MIVIRLRLIVKYRWVNGKHLQGLSSADAMYLFSIANQFPLLGRP
jgi:hypothetical protein